MNKFEVLLEGYITPSLIIEAQDKDDAADTAQKLLRHNFPRANVIQVIKK